MSKAYIYILAANSDPDKITCSVPIKIDENEIFFGPCKKRLRVKFRKYIGKEINDEIYIIGINSSYKNDEGNFIRKILWAGKLKK